MLWEDQGGGGTAAIKSTQLVTEPMKFFTGGITASDERMRLTANGRLGIGQTAPGGALHVNHGTVNAIFQRDGGSSKLVIKPNAGDDGMTIQGQSNSANSIILDTNGAAAAVKITNSDHGTLATFGSTLALLKATDITGNLGVTGSVTATADFPDVTLKSGGERRVLFSDAGGSAEGGIKFASNTFKIFAGGGIASGNEAIACNGTTIETKDDLVQNPGSSVTPAENGEMVVEATNNTTLTFKLKGSDGTVRSGTITLS